MFKLSIPLTIAISSGSCLMLLAIGSLLLVGSTVQTSDIQTTSETRDAHELTRTLNNNQSNASSTQPEAAQSSFLSSGEGSSDNLNKRRRNGRMHIGSANYGGSSHTQSQQTAIDNYAAAYANHPAESAQSNAQANDASTFSSFGEPAPSSISSPLRQLTLPNSASANGGVSNADYGPAHSNYYANYMSPSSNDATYSSGQSALASGSSANYNVGGGSYGYSQPHSTAHHHHKSTGLLSYPTLAGYGDRHGSSSFYERMPMHGSVASPFWSGFGSLPSSSFGGGLMSSASSALSHWTNGFTLSEIICGLIAVTIGAIILGAPFFLIYLALMGNFSGSGTLSLTNPLQGTSSAGGTSTTVSGRRKRLAILEPLSEKQIKNPDVMAFAESIASHLSPFVNMQQVSGTLKQLLESMERFSGPLNESKRNGVKLK